MNAKKGRNAIPMLVWQVLLGALLLLIWQEGVNAGLLDKFYSNQGYEKLFDMYAKIYFNGCDIADNGGGWDFLDAAGRVFLKTGGGVTLAQTKLGHLLIPSGHIAHFFADTAYSVFLPGGVSIGHYTK
jgi:hypothetical protein